GVLRPRHRDNASHVLYAVVYSVSQKLAFYLLVRAAEAGSERVSALYHKAAYYPVECQPVIEVVLDQLQKVFYGYRSLLGIKLQLDLFSVFHFNSYHSCFLLSYISYIISSGSTSVSPSG